VQRHIYFQGVYEPVEAYLFSRLAAPGMTVVDAGANVGQYTLIASARVGPSGAVHSFEPVPETYRVLAEHVAANRAANVVANRAACASLGYGPADLWDLLVRDLGYSAWRAGNSAAEWVRVPAADALVRANVLFVCGPLPASVSRGWTLRGILRWAGAGRSR